MRAASGISARVRQWHRICVRRWAGDTARSHALLFGSPWSACASSPSRRVLPEHAARLFVCSIEPCFSAALSIYFAPPWRRAFCRNLFRSPVRATAPLQQRCQTWRTRCMRLADQPRAARIQARRGCDAMSARSMIYGRSPKPKQRHTREENARWRFGPLERGLVAGDPCGARNQKKRKTRESAMGAHRRCGNRTQRSVSVIPAALALYANLRFGWCTSEPWRRGVQLRWSCPRAAACAEHARSPGCRAAARAAEQACLFPAPTREQELTTCRFRARIASRSRFDEQSSPPGACPLLLGAQGASARSAWRVRGSARPARP